ncbi:MAG: Rnf-Nqr domain containing protein, partial [Planctomycetota bacterium]
MSDVVQLPSAGERFSRGVLPENPVFRQLLGMCPVLAVTNSMAGALTMGLATT